MNNHEVENLEGSIYQLIRKMKTIPEGEERDKQYLELRQQSKRYKELTGEYFKA